MRHALGAVIVLLVPFGGTGPGLPLIVAGEAGVASAAWRSTSSASDGDCATSRRS
jgi:hypothetical protein